MQLFYITIPNIYIAIDDRKIFEIQKSTSKIINPHAITVHSISATPMEEFGVRDGTLYLDGLMIVELAGWLRTQFPNATTATFGRRFWELFRDGDKSFLPDTIKAVIRVAMDRAEGVAGEDAFFVAEQWRQHSEEFAELLAAHQSPVSINGSEDGG